MLEMRRVIRIDVMNISLQYFSMSSQKFSKTDFSLSHYYQQLQKYESGSTAPKRPSLKKDYSLSTFSKDHSRVSNLSKTHNKEPGNQERSRLDLNEKYGSKVGVDRMEKHKFEKVKKFVSGGEHFKANSYLAESLNSSNITRDKWTNESRVQEKENLPEIPFSGQDEQKFVHHCSQLYKIKGTDSLVNDIAQQIKKRDEVYQVVSQNLGGHSHGLPEKVKQYFQEHQLMVKVIEEFKLISKLQIDDLNELYYFLKSDR